MNKISNINEMIDKMELNFKLGNSFYWFYKVNNSYLNNIWFFILTSA